MTYRLGELFAGAGGMALGAHQAGFAHAWASDGNADACRTFERNFPDTKVICSDVRDLDIASLSAIDGLCGGFPCQSFSMAGRRLGLEDEKSGKLYEFMIDVLNIHQPKFVIGENVAAIQSKGLDVILADIDAAGYDTFYHNYKFEDFGVPQMRHRIIIVGFRKDLNIMFRHPEPTHKDNPVTCGQALVDIPAGATHHEKQTHPPEIVERLRHIPPGDNVWTEQMPEHLRRYTSGAKMSHIYRRMHPDRPAYTLTASGGGGTQGFHHAEPRALTNRERARLQTFPDDFNFVGNGSSVRKQIGMAVPPLGAKVIFEQIRKTLENPAEQAGASPSPFLVRKS